MAEREWSEFANLAAKERLIAEMEALASLSFDNVSSFDVLGALKEELSEREFATVEELNNAE